MTTSRTVGVIVVGMLTLAGCSNEEPYALPSDITPVSKAPETPAPSPTAEQSQADGEQFNEAETVAIENAKNAVTRFYEVSDLAYGDPENAGEKPFSNVAINPVRSDELGQLGYYLQEGWRSTGKTTVEFARIRSVKPESDPEEFIYPKVVLDICVDYSDIDLIDKNGESIKGKGSDRDPATIGAYEEPGEGWFIEYLEYTESDACTQ